MAEIRVNATGGLKLYDADDSHYAQIKAGTISSNTDVLELGSGAIIAGTKIDLNGQELILDADADTSITADTDDQIDFKIAGADDLRMTANAINVLSGTTLTIDSGATITNSGTANGFGTDPDGAQTFNESGAAVDFRVEGDADTHLLMIDGSSDKVGIGEDVPEGKLHIFTGDASVGPNAQADELIVEGSGHAGISILSGNDDKGNIYFGDSGDDDIGSITYHHDGNTMRFTTNASEAVRIQSDGDISIGTTANEARLDTRYDANASGFQIHNQKSSGCNSSTKVAVIQGDQDSSGSYDLVHIRNGGGHVCNIADSGNIQNSGNSYGSLSDNRIKQNITDANSQWNDIKALKIKNFKLKKLVNRDGDSAPTHLGVIAQDLETSNMNGLVEEISPTKEDVALSSDFGSIDGKGDFTEGQKVKTVKYSVLYMKAIKALQEAITKIESLEARVTTLEG
jgi:hypothetical protein